MKTKEFCPKCESHNVTFEGNWTGVMVSDIHAEHFWLGKCKSCGFTFTPSNNDKPDAIHDRRNHG